MFDEQGDLRDRTREFAKRVARAFRALPVREERIDGLKTEAGELIAIFVALLRKRGGP